MKIQSLAIIFVIIVLPISIVLSEYVQAQTDTLSLQTLYDSRLIDATYDAVTAFQKNTINSTSSSVTNSKMRDVEASANTFLNSVANNFGLSGNSKDAMQSYIPAVVYTLYDGYYIYSQYSNTRDNGNAEQGIKPYIYYSREYNYGGSEFVITYSLDNYISIQGEINGKYVNDSGYLIDINDPNTTINDTTVIYKGVTIGTETLTEYVDKDNEYKYVKVNGVKYYLDDKNPNDDNYGKIFSFVQSERTYLSEASSNRFKEEYSFDQNDSAQEYYRQASDFTKRVIYDYKLSKLKSSDGKGYGETIYKASNGEIYTMGQSDYEIFTIDNIEEPYSDFNQERTAVIRYAIEKNLSTAIANYNNFSGSTNNFQMPTLKEDEWDKIINNVSVISFLQGMNIGTKTYNGYAIVTNNKNQEVVTENSIYITTSDGEFHKVSDSDLSNKTLAQGVYNIDFERKAIGDENGAIVGYYYPKKQTGCYTSIVNHTTVEPVANDNIYEYLEGKGDIAKLYYTALGRERQGMYRVTNGIESYS